MRLWLARLSILALILLAWAVGAHASLDYSFGVSSEGNSVSSSTHLDANLGTVVRPGFISGADGLTETCTSTSSSGDTATVYYNVTNAGTFIRPTLDSVGDGGSFAQAWLRGLTATNASYILAWAKATSHNGQKAAVSTEVKNGSISNYYASAYADGALANASQNFTSAEGDQVLIDGVNATNDEGDHADLSARAFNAVIEGYQSRASSYADRVDLYQKISDGAIYESASPESGIFMSANGSNAEGDSVRDESDLNLGRILTGTQSFSRGGPAAEACIEIWDGNLSAYNAGSHANSTFARANESFHSAEGYYIRINGINATNAGGDWAQARTSVVNGDIVDYSSKALAYLDHLHVYQEIAGGIGISVPSEKMSIYTIASNAAGDSTRTFAQMRDGSIDNVTSRADASATEVSSRRTINGAHGEYVSFGSNATNGQVTARSSAALTGNESAPATVDSFFSSARANSTYVRARSNVTNVAAARINASAGADDILNGSFGTQNSVNIRNGTLDTLGNAVGFVGEAYTAEGAPDHAASSSFFTASGESIQVSTRANNSLGNYARTSAQLRNGSIDNVTSRADASVTDFSSRRTINGAHGEYVSFGSNATNGQVTARSSAALTGNESAPATVDSFFSSARANNTYVRARSNVTNAAAARINASAGADDILNGSFGTQNSVNIRNGTLDTLGNAVGFVGEAYTAEGAPDHAASSSFFTASGESIQTNTRASDSSGDYAMAGANVANGFIGSYQSSSYARFGSVNVNREMNNAVGSLIDIGFRSHNNNGGAEAGAIVDGYSGLLGSSWGSAYAEELGGAGADNWVNNAQGENVNAGFGAGKGSSGSDFYARGGANVSFGRFNGSTHGYYDETGLIPQVSGWVHIDDAENDAGAGDAQITLGVGSGNSAGDQVGAGGTVNRGLIKGYDASAAASATFADSSISSTYDPEAGPSEAQGNSVSFGWGASNAEGDWISGHTFAGWESARVTGYSNYAHADAHTVKAREDFDKFSGNDVYSEWIANSADGESLAGNIFASDWTGLGAYLTGGKLTTASKRSVEASLGASEFGEVECLSPAYFEAVGSGSANWHTSDKRGEEVNGVVTFSDEDFGFRSQQSAVPFAVASSIKWSAGGAYSGLASGLDMFWSAGDKRSDYCTIQADASNANTEGQNSLSARTDIVEVSSSVKGEGERISTGWYAWNTKGDNAYGSASVGAMPVPESSEGQASYGTLDVSNHALVTTKRAEGSESVTADGTSNIQWHAYNRENDSVDGNTNIRDGYVEANNSAKSSKTSATGSEQIELDASYIDSFSTSQNAKGHKVQTHVIGEAGYGEAPFTTYAKYNSSEIATKTAAKAVQEVSDAEGTLEAGGEAGNALQAESNASMANGSSFTSSSSFKSDASGATASQAMTGSGESVGFHWHAANSEGDLVDGSTTVYSGSLDASYSATALSNSVTGSETIWFDAAEGIAGSSSAGNAARNDTAETYVTGFGREARANYTSSATATKTYALANLVVPDVTGSLSMWGIAGQLTAADSEQHVQYAHSYAGIINGTGNSTASFRSDATGATATQTMAGQGDKVNFHWLAFNLEGDRAWGETTINNGWLKARDPAKATATYAQGSQQAELNATTVESWASARNAGGYYAKTGVFNPEGEWLPPNTYVKYTSGAKAVSTAADASLEIKDSRGSVGGLGRAGQITNGFENQFAFTRAVVKNGTAFTSTVASKSDATGATATETAKTSKKYEYAASKAFAGRGELKESEILTNFTTTTGTSVTNGSAFSSTENAYALWSGTGAKRELTATAAQSVTAMALGEGGEIGKVRGAAYQFNETTQKFAGLAKSAVTIKQGKITSLVDNAQATNTTATVNTATKAGTMKLPAVKFDVAGVEINRSFNAYSEVGKLWMWTNVTDTSKLATLKDTAAYKASASKDTLTLGGKWRATGTKTTKNGFADSYNVAGNATVTKSWPPGSPSGITDSGTVTAKKQVIK